ncbi:MAG: hypothetical protein U5K79_17530 [Cyclobacteriaceae bacterium]|nr:hypothetical protein [Cyclobacteriaceae bacterium]
MVLVRTLDDAVKGALKLELPKEVLAPVSITFLFPEYHVYITTEGAA